MASSAAGARKVVSYGDIDMSAAASSSSSSSSALGATTSGKRPNWDGAGQALTASAGRKLRKLLSLARGGNVEQVETMLKSDASVVGANANEELKEALRVARRAMRGEGDEEEDDDDEEEEEDVEYDDEYEEYGDYDDAEGLGEDEGEAIGAAFDWQGVNGNANGSTVGGGRPLTHQEVWDDDALKGAWDAAVEEYEIFHRRRQEAQGSTEQQDQADALLETNGKRKRQSALWYDSPAPGSEAALLAKKRQQVEAEELARRKLEAKKLVRGLAVSNGTSEAPSSSTSVGQAGAVPPSQHLTSSSPAWKQACATVARTPNRIGPSSRSIRKTNTGNEAATQRTEKQQAAATATSASTGSAVQTPTAPPATASSEDVLQNLAMAWYYAGYYQAQAQALIANSQQEQGN